MTERHYAKINNLSAWVVFLVAAITYSLTMEASGSFWDCGEFASCAFKLQNPHPPGSPLFVLIGRVFVILFGSIMGNVVAINFLSAMASAFTILFLFWTITFFARRMLVKKDTIPNGHDVLKIMAAGVIGSLAFTFSDTFWFNAVEAEVYALSSFFSALTLWTVLKWNNATDRHEAFADKWLVLTAFTIGMGVGVHLLNLLIIPAAVFLYYFKNYTTSRKGLIWTFVIACAITGISQTLVISTIPKMAATFDLVFVNSFGLPFNSGAVFFIVVLGLGLYFAMKWFIRKNWYLAKLLTWCAIFIIIGFSTYTVPIIRSNADTPIDMYNVDNMQTMVGYLSREQYGDVPIVYGPVFTAQPIDREDKGPKYNRVGKKYVEVGREVKDVFASKDKMLFPRVWDYTNQQNHIVHYRAWLGLAEGQVPSFADNLKFFFAYQINWLYVRYFMWNFAGRQNDNQNVSGNVRDGNWISGISFLDSWRLGDQSKVPSYMKEMPSRNTLFLLPFVLGVLGLVLQYKKHKKDLTVLALSFFFMGVAVMIYNNMPGNQPRERDYVFVGSFYVFAVWIGLGVLYVIDFATKYMRSKIATYVSIAICLAGVPVLMAAQEWDDHDRGNKTLVLDIGRNYLESCPKNAVLFCYGDNDTYPLWYAQQIEGIRPDVRVVNTALLGAEWYVNQLRYKLDESNSVPLAFSAEKTVGSESEIVFFNINKQLNNSFYDLDTLLNMSIEQRLFDVRTQGGMVAASLPVSNFLVNGKEENIRQNIESLSPDDVIEPSAKIVIPESYLEKYLFRNDVAVLATVAAFKWERPVCFTSPSFFSDFNLYGLARNNGLVYEMVSLKNNNGINVHWMLDRIEKNKLTYNTFKNKNVYYNEEDRRNINMLRRSHLDLVSAMYQTGRVEEAKRIFKKSLQDIPHSAISMVDRNERFGESYYISLQIAEWASKLGEKQVFATVAKGLTKNLEEEIAYFNSLNTAQAAAFEREIKDINQLLNSLKQLQAPATPLPQPKG